MCARLYADPEEAELGPAQGRSRPPDDRDRGHRVHPRHRPQPAGALGRADPRRPRQGPAGRPLPHHPRHARHRRHEEPQEGALEVRRQAGKGQGGSLEMPRRNRPVKRVVAPDPLYQSEAIAKFVNVVMNRGKRSTAEKVVYDALSRASKQAKKEPLEVFDLALRNATPLLEVKPRRVGGATYQVPVEIRPERRLALARRWLVRFARQRGGKSMSEKLAFELLDAAQNTGGAVKRKEETHRMAESNKAFSHFRY